jgi:hypothetical protein
MGCDVLTLKGEKCKKRSIMSFEISGVSKRICAYHLTKSGALDDDEFYISHSTSLDNIEKILKTGGLTPISVSSEESNWGISKYPKNYKDQVFTSLIFQNDTGFLFKPEKIESLDRAWIFFGIDIMEKYPNHFCDHWIWGRYNSGGCKKYNTKETPLKNANDYKYKWYSGSGENRRRYKNPDVDGGAYGNHAGELVFNMKNVPDKKLSLKDSLFIYIPNSYFCEHLKKEYPQYNFVDEIPFKTYKQSLLSLKRELKEWNEKIPEGYKLIIDESYFE